jgi:hypothetical protein
MHSFSLEVVHLEFILRTFIPGFKLSFNETSVVFEGIANDL